MKRCGSALTTSGVVGWTPRYTWPGASFKSESSKTINQIRPLDFAASVDRFGAEPGKGNHRRAAPFGAEQSEVLGVESGENAAVAEYAAGDLGALAAAAVKSYFDHWLTDTCR